jgi:DNA-binding Lrp family transcriptional regulator
MIKSGYDRTFCITIDNEKIKYGILYGNEKIVFIKSGADGNFRGEQDKYLRMAYRVHRRIGATVICASNPDISECKHLKADEAFLRKVIGERGFEKYELYFVGTSDGGYRSLLLAQQFAQTSAYLGINSSHIGIEEFAQRLQSLPKVRKYLVYGSEDTDFDVDVPAMSALACENLEIVVLEGVNHEFTDRLEDFVALIDLM